MPPTIVRSDLRLPLGAEKRGLAPKQTHPPSPGPTVPHFCAFSWPFCAFSWSRRPASRPTHPVRGQAPLLGTQRQSEVAPKPADLSLRKPTFDYFRLTCVELSSGGSLTYECQIAMILCSIESVMQATLTQRFAFMIRKNKI